MGLKPLRQIEHIHDDDFPTLATSERGGILSFATASGLTYLTYARDPSGVVPLGIQLNDIEYLNLAYQPFPHARDIRMPYDLVKVLLQGDVETDWLYVSGQLYAGMPAYVGPSGTITNLPDFGSYRIGKFMGPLISDPHAVIFAGKGFTRTYMEYETHQIVTENNPTDQIRIAVPGYAKVRIDQKTITYSQIS